MAMEEFCLMLTIRICQCILLYLEISVKYKGIRKFEYLLQNEP